MNEHLPECFETWAIPRKCNICDALRDCQERVTHQSNREWAEIAVDGEARVWGEALDAARAVVAGFLDIDTETGDRRCSDPGCDLCIAAPLIYAALEDLVKGWRP